MNEPAPRLPSDGPVDAQTLRRLFESVRQGLLVAVMGREASRTLTANPHAKLIFGYSPETPDADFRPFDRDGFVDSHARDALLSQLARDGGVTDLLLRLRRVDGSTVWVEVTAQAEPDADGAFRLDAILRDVSERKRLDDQTRELHHQLLQAEKLAALGQTISGVAHELNNPLATILASAERLIQRQGDAALMRRTAETILGEAERAAKIVRSLLTFARKRHTTRSMVDVNQVVRDTIALRQFEQSRANITVIDALASGLPPVFADPHQLQQVLLNLVINAEQAMVSAHGRGTLLLRSWQVADHDAVALEINDDGPGMPEEVLPRIFDPFFTTKAAGQGTGLGLTVAYAIVQEHGGRLSAESRPGGGASFFVELPTGGTAVRPAAPKAPVAEESGAGASVLVVEDEAALASAVAEGLTDAGFTVQIARDGQEALQYLETRQADLIVCDLRMPRLDGPSFYRAMAARSPSAARRIIFVTGDVAGTDAERFLEESGCRWLPKPFRLADLLRVARDVLG
jgi:PAS domain S-box-containing protein